MKNNYFLLACLLLASAWQGALGQTLDPVFTPSNIFSSGTIYSTTEQPDGKRVVAGSFTWVNGTAASNVVRFETNGSVDATFQQNLGAAVRAYRPRVLANGQLLLTGFGGGQIVAGGISRHSVLRLNADGTGDATFDAGTGASSFGNPIFVDDILPLANGQVIVVGPFDHFNGVAANRIVRLTATGAIDPTFAPGGGASGEIDIVVGLSNGQMLIGGLFTSYAGQPANGITRLNANGTLDTSFASPFSNFFGNRTEATNLVVQPDGNILVAGALFPVGGTVGKGLLRLLPSGTIDPSFSPPGVIIDYSAYSYLGDAVQLQTDGKILYLVNNVGSGTPGVARLNANGTADNTFQPATANIAPTSLTLLASGQVLVGGNFSTFNGTANRPLTQLTASGASTAFLPLIQITGTVRSLVRQTDGKLIAGGSFTEVDGQAVTALARFNANGGLDATFLPVLPYVGSNVGDIILQPDGRLLVAFEGAVVRYLSTGALDNTFSAASSGSLTRRLALQPDGRVLVGNQFGGGTMLIRLLANGANDASFASVSTGAGGISSVQALALQSDGKIVVAGDYTPVGATQSISTVVRVLANGAVDGTFSSSPFMGVSTTSGLTSLAVQSDGKVMVVGRFTSYGGTSRSLVARLNADGSLDGAFVPPMLTGTINKVLLQPNEGVLLGGFFSGTGVSSNLARLLPTGQVDGTFGTTAEPNSTVNELLVQPDGKIVLGGSFAALSGQTSPAVARIVASNVLAVAAPASVVARTEAWPVPAHEQLNVQTDGSAHAQTLDLVDLLGRVVRHTDLRAGTTAATLRCDNLPVGTYLLRVTYAEGVVARRVQVQ